MTYLGTFILHLTKVLLFAVVTQYSVHLTLLTAVDKDRFRTANTRYIISLQIERNEERNKE